MADWIAHDGGPCPVIGKRGTARCRDGVTSSIPDIWNFGIWCWKGGVERKEDVIAYRLVQPEPAACEHDWVRVRDGWPTYCLKCKEGVDKAFPEPLARDMTVREHMRFEAAKAAMQGMLAAGAEKYDYIIAERAVEHADALLAALQEKHE